MEDKDMKTALVQNWIQNIGTQIAEVIGSLDTSVGSSDGLPLGPPVWEDDERLQDFEKVHIKPHPTNKTILTFEDGEQTIYDGG